MATIQVGLTPQPTMGVVLVLDAMGVIFQSADDVVALLMPFVAEHGDRAERAVIQDLYVRASLGQMTAAEFWTAAGVSPELEDRYLARHRLSEGVIDFVERLPASVDAVWCLSNDVSEWSRKLRACHGLENRFAGFVISGDVGSRKPDEQIYRKLLERVGRPPAECVFVDDRAKNLLAARALGFRTVGFGSAAGGSAHGERWVGSFRELREEL